MKLVEEYLRHAEECRKLAAQAGVAEQRKAIQRITATWEKLAASRRKLLEGKERNGAAKSR
jgi:hypothetical protein